MFQAKGQKGDNAILVDAIESVTDDGLGPHAAGGLTCYPRGLATHLRFTQWSPLLTRPDTSQLFSIYAREVSPFAVSQRL